MPWAQSPCLLTQRVLLQVSYRAQQGDTRRAVQKMVLVWVLAFLLYGPAILSWEYLSGGSSIPEGHCYAEFFYNWYFLITASTLEFFTPFLSDLLQPHHLPEHPEAHPCPAGWSARGSHHRASTGGPALSTACRTQLLGMLAERVRGGRAAAQVRGGGQRGDPRP